MESAHVVPVPEPVLAVLRDLIALRFSGTGRDPAPALEALPAALPEGEVRRLASGGAFGWMADARIDVVDGRVAVEVLEDSRMAGPEHYRLWDDGTREELPTEHIGYLLPKHATPEDEARVKEEYFLHNRRVQQELRERGF